jgi:hypothetical protein
VAGLLTTKNQSLASHVEQAFGLPCNFFSILLEIEIHGELNFARGPLEERRIARAVQSA